MTNKKRLELMANHFNKHCDGFEVKVFINERPHMSGNIEKKLVIVVNGLNVYVKSYLNMDDDKLYDMAILELVNHGVMNCYMDVKRRMKDYMHDSPKVFPYKKEFKANDRDGHEL